MNFVTDLADLAVVLPLAMLIAATCLAAGWRRGALAWCFVFPGLCLVMLVLKILTFSHGHLLARIGLHSPSGHTAVAILAYGGLFALSTGLRPGAVFLIGILVGAAIGTTRVALGYHTVTDIVVGAVVGLCGLRVLTGLASACPPSARSTPRLLLLLVAVAGYATLGVHLPAEGYIRRLALP